MYWKMSSPDFKEIYPKGLDAELCAGYYDGGGNRKKGFQSNHPAYIHGFLNRVDDINHKPRKSARELRETLAYIEAVLDET